MWAAGAGAGGGRGARWRPGRAGGCAGRGRGPRRAGSGGPRGPRRRAAPGRLWRRGAGRGAAEGRAEPPCRAEPSRAAQSREGRSRDGTRHALLSWAVPAEPRRAKPNRATPSCAVPCRAEPPAQHGPLALAVPPGRPGPGRQLPPQVQPLHRGGCPAQRRSGHGPAGPCHGPQRCPGCQPAQVGIVTAGPYREGTQAALPPGSAGRPQGAASCPDTAGTLAPAGHQHMLRPACVRGGGSCPQPVLPCRVLGAPPTWQGAAPHPLLTRRPRHGSLAGVGGGHTGREVVGGICEAPGRGHVAGMDPGVCRGARGAGCQEGLRRDPGVEQRAPGKRRLSAGAGGRAGLSAGGCRLPRVPRCRGSGIPGLVPVQG